MSKAQEVAAEITSRLAAITVANGYDTDIGARAMRGRIAMDVDMLPCVVLYEEPDTAEDSRPNEIKISAAYTIEGHAACDPDNPNDTAHMIVSDIKRAIFGGQRMLGGKVRDLRYVSRSIAPRQDGMSIVSAAVQITASFYESLIAP